MHFIILFYHMLIYNLHCQLVLRISGNTNMLDKNTSNTSVSSGQLNDDDHCLLVRAKLKKKICVRIEAHGARCGGKFN